MEKRINRDQQSRAADTRRAQLNPVMNMNAINPLHVPKELIPDGMTYLWGRVSVLSEPDISRSSALEFQGWTPVPSSRHPELCAKDYLNRLEHLKPYVFRSGLILFEMPTERYNEIQRRYNWETYQVTNSLPGLNNLMGDPGIHVEHEFGSFGDENYAQGRKNDLRHDSGW